VLGFFYCLFLAQMLITVSLALCSPSLVSSENRNAFALQVKVLIIIIIINRHFRNAQLTMNRHKGARGDAEPGLTLIQVRFQ